MNRPAEELAPPIFDYSDDPLRDELRRRLGIGPYLARRQAFRIGPDGVHCEYYHYSDDAPLLLFLPGIGTYCELYAELLARISDRGFNVVGVDPRGHGYSDGSRGVYTVASTVCDLERVISALQGRSNGRVLVYGYSIGAVVALALAEADKRVDSVLCGTLLLTEEPPDMLHQMGWFWTWGAAQWFPGLRVPLRSFMDFDTLLAGNPAGEVINDDPLVVFDYPVSTLASLFTHRAAICSSAFDFRLGIIQGDRDEVLPVSYANRVIDRVAHPTELLVLPDEGHMIPWDDPAHLAQRACDWLHL
ncbi:alpha/beta hydrolase [Marinobacterium sp. YM272]|uniref:alpha/beta hydrolase n=1 Tax=Marinobacterium sp. YM272 TaxID=3421654 RepID=UPI003D7FF54F